MHTRRLITLLAAPALLAGLAVAALPASAAPPPPQDAEVSDLQVVPTLKEWHGDDGADFHLGGHVVLPQGAGEELTAVAATFADDLEALTGRHVPVNSGRARPGDVQLDLSGDHELGAEGYQLDVDGTLTITGPTAHGVFNGTRSVLQLLSRAEVVPAGTARDWPTKPVRSVLVDNTPRHFSITWWESFFRQMSYFKLNDTNLYIDGVGITPEQMTQIDELGQRYYVQVVPQLNMPGHMATVLPSHPEYQLRNQDGTLDPQALDLTNEDAVEWALSIIEDTIDQFSSDVWHLGSDEFPSWPGTGENHPQLTEYAQQKFGPEATFADLFADFQNRANEIVQAHGKTMRVWNDMIRQSDVVTLDEDIAVEYWISHPALPGLLSPQDIADRGNQLVNADVDLLYYDMSRRNLDPRDLYEQFDVNTFTADQQVDPDHVAGARIAVWLAWIGTPMESDAEVLSNLRPDMAALTQHTWGEGPEQSWTDFSALVDELGLPPGLVSGGHSMTGEPALAANPDGSIAWFARDEEGRLWSGQQHDPGSGPWSRDRLATRVVTDPQTIVDDDGRVHVLAGAAHGRVLHAWQTSPGADTYRTERPGRTVDGPPAPFLDADGVGWAARAGGDLVVRTGDGEQSVVASSVTGPVAAAVADGTVHVLAATSEGIVHAWRTGSTWQTETEDLALDADPVLVADDGQPLAVVRSGDQILARDLGTGEGWAQVADAAHGQPAVTVGADGTAHVAYLRSGNQVWYAHRGDGDWSTRVAWYDFVEDPAILVQQDGQPIIMGQNDRGFLAAVQPDPDDPEADWQWAHLAESTSGTPAMILDAEDRATYAVTTSYGDLQTGTRWGAIADWGRDFIVGTIQFPGDGLVPDQFPHARFADHFDSDTSGDYELLTMSDSEPALAPEVVDGRLQVSGRDYYSMLLAEENLPTAGETTVVLDIEELADPGGSENSLYLGFAQDADNRAVAWYDRNASRLGFDIVTDGQSFGGWGDVPAHLRPGDRLAVTLSGRWLTAYRWHDGQWDRIHTAPVNGNDDITDPQVRAEYRPAVGFRATSGTLAVDNLELRTRG